ncbi:MAG: SRPBCC family protein [Actinomycetota bacterium]|nr:SRPBCC family protein [Actinomycetota bacterium]
MRITSTKTIPAARDDVWETVADPYHLPRWWPRVQRVEEVEGAAWTKVMISSRGRAVRADYTRVETDAPRRMLWRQEVDESPFERLLAEATIELELEEAGEERTKVRLTADQSLRGKTRFGGMMVRRATKRTLNEALDGLKRAFGG